MRNYIKCNLRAEIEGKECRVDYVELFDGYVTGHIHLVAIDDEEFTDFIVWYMSEEGIKECLEANYDKVWWDDGR